MDELPPAAVQEPHVLRHLATLQRREEDGTAWNRHHRQKKGKTKDKLRKNINSTTKGRRLKHPLLLLCIGGQEVKMQPLSWPWPGRMSSLRWWRIRCRKSLLEGTSVVQSRALAYRAILTCRVTSVITFASWIHLVPLVPSLMSLQVGPSVSWHLLACHLRLYTLDLPNHVGEQKLRLEHLLACPPQQLRKAKSFAAFLQS